MSRARIILLMLVAGFLISGAIRAAQRDQAPRENSTVAPAPATTAAPTATQTVSAVLPGAAPVLARPGDRIELTVRSAKPDIAKIVALGVSIPVGPGVAGTASFPAGAPGDYPVTLELAGDDAGLLRVTETP